MRHGTYVITLNFAPDLEVAGEYHQNDFCKMMMIFTIAVF